MKNLKEIYFTLMIVMPVILHTTIMTALNNKSKDQLLNALMLLPFIGILCLVISVISFFIMRGLYNSELKASALFLPIIVGILIFYGAVTSDHFLQGEGSMFTYWLFLPFFYSTLIHGCGLIVYDKWLSKTSSANQKISILAGVAIVSVLVIALLVVPGKIESLIPAKQEVDPFLMETLEEYVISEQIDGSNKEGEIAFEEMIIALPFPVNNDDVVFGDNFMMVKREGQPLFFISDSEMTVQKVSEIGITDFKQDLLIGRSIGYIYSYSSRYGFSTIADYLNETPEIGADGSLKSRASYMGSPAMMLKRDIAFGFGFIQNSELRMKRIVFTNPEIRGIMYEVIQESMSSKVTVIYEGEAVKYILVLDEERQNGDYMDYILQSVNSQL